MSGLYWLLIITASSFILLVLWAIVTTKEQRLGRRFFAVHSRKSLDIAFDQIIAQVAKWYILITRHKMKLSWYYSIHTVLVAVLAFLGTTYNKIENIVIANRVKAKQIRKEKHSFIKSHLTEIAEHKVNVKLSKKEQTRRKKASLKGQ